ncbi:hypothetical protein ACQ7DA_11480 [Zafaria sp. J156]|uniref:hypothetical protein n=1 Tax=Zafaria sp. J156 TaxID=3116490 RepID=UPI002E76A289|nr:hypothetical protein [Zafaria sp. J156]MEE1621778.1 hypothetical protein [Zafaria sp. J156]
MARIGSLRGQVRECGVDVYQIFPGKSDGLSRWRFAAAYVAATLWAVSVAVVLVLEFLVDESPLIRTVLSFAYPGALVFFVLLVVFRFFPEIKIEIDKRGSDASE